MTEETNTSFGLSLGTALIFTLTIVIQLVFAHLGDPDATWIIIGIIGLGLGFIGLYIYYSKTLIIIGFDAIYNLSGR